jgi:hypothetical protein
VEDPDAIRFDHEFVHEVCIHCDLSDACEDTECPVRLRKEVARLHDYNERGLVCSKHWVHPSKCCNGKYTAHLISERSKKKITYLENELADWRTDVEEVDEILEGIEFNFDLGSDVSTAENVKRLIKKYEARLKISRFLLRKYVERSSADQKLIDKYEAKFSIVKTLVKEIRGTFRLIEFGAITFTRGSAMILGSLATVALSEIDEE